MFTFTPVGQTPNALITAEMELVIPRCLIVPAIEKIQEKFAAVVLNVVETFYAVSTWGKQAKTFERRQRRALLEEVRYEHNFFTTITEHKETIRMANSFAGGLLLLHPYIERLMLHIYKEQCYLWSDNQGVLLDAFAATKPLIVAIREQFTEYDDITAALQSANKVTTIGSVVIYMAKAYDAFIEYSKTWKVNLGARLISSYKVQLDEMVDFIKEMELTLGRPLRDLDDVRMAMTCLEKIRETSIE